MSSAASLKFASIETYARTYQEATEAEHKSEKRELERFNESGQRCKLWVIKQLPFKGGSQEYIVRLDPKPFETTGYFADWDLPQIGESCVFVVAETPDGTDADDYQDLRATRTPDLIQLPRAWNNLVEFQVSIPVDEKGLLVGNHGSNPLPSSRQAYSIGIMLKISSTTCRAELWALDQLYNAGDRLPIDKETQQHDRNGIESSGQALQLAAFEYLVLWKEPSVNIDLSRDFPHMFNTDLIVDQDLQRKLRAEHNKLDVDQLAAFESLTKIPAGVALLPGCTGAGKTTFALHVTAMAQAVDNRCKVLYIMDINKALDDAANGLYETYKSLGMSKTVIRMYKWPVEFMKGNDNRSLMSAARSKPSDPRFALAFSQQAERWEKNGPFCEHRHWTKRRLRTSPSIVSNTQEYRDCWSGCRVAQMSNRTSWT
jgi:hypothetical protein